MAKPLAPLKVLVSHTASHLPGKSRRLLALHAMGASHREIAEIMACSPKGVGKLLGDARRKARRVAGGRGGASDRRR